MPKIKNWNKVSDMRWRKDNRRGSVRISKVKRGVYDGQYMVQASNNGNSKTRYFETKEEAKDYAVGYMRNHPEGF